jgi:hypothetical protein
MARSSIATDDFNRAAIGANWAQLNNDWGQVDTLGSTQVAGNNAADGNNRPVARWVGAGTFTNDQYSSVEVSALSFQGANFFIGVIVRASGDVNAARDFYAAFVASDSAGPNYTVSLIKVVNGTTTVLHSAAIAWTANQRIELEAEGTSLRVCKDGTPLGGSFTQTDTDLASGSPGITGTHSTCPGDNWDGGNLVAASGDASFPSPNSPSRRMISWARRTI